MDIQTCFFHITTHTSEFSIGLHTYIVWNHVITSILVLIEYFDFERSNKFKMIINYTSLLFTDFCISV